MREVYEGVLRARKLHEAFIFFSSESEYSSSDEINSSMTSSCYNNGGAGPFRKQDIAFSKFFSTMKESYGVELKAPRKSDISLYKK